MLQAEKLDGEKSFWSNPNLIMVFICTFPPPSFLILVSTSFVLRKVLIIKIYLFQMEQILSLFPHQIDLLNIPGIVYRTLNRFNPPIMTMSKLMNRSDPTFFVEPLMAHWMTQDLKFFPTRAGGPGGGTNLKMGFIFENF